MENRIVRTAAQTAVLMAILTLGSKLIGFVREMVMANYFGAGYVVDAYAMASTILSTLFGGLILAISTVYIPVYSRIAESEGKEKSLAFTNQIVNFLLIITVVISILGILFSDQITSISAPGFEGETAKLTSFFIKTLFSYLIFSSLAGILESYLQYRGTFLPQILAGYFVSIASIAVIAISAFTSSYYLAFGMLIGNFLRFVTIYIIARRREYRYEPKLSAKNTINQIMILAIPVFVGSYAQYINLFVDKTLASSLEVGSIAALNYASLLTSMIISLTVTILSTITFPKLAKADSQKDYTYFNKVAAGGINIILIVTIPCTLGAMIYSKQIVQIVYERGAFDLTDTIMTSTAFMYYSGSLAFQALNVFLVRIYYSKHDMKTPMIYAVICVIINIVLSLILVKHMVHDGLALATSISALANTILLYIGVSKKYKEMQLIESKVKMFKLLMAAILSVGFSYIVYNFCIMPLAHIIYIRVVQLGLAVAIVGIVYLLLLKLFKIEEILLIKQLVRKR